MDKDDFEFKISSMESKLTKLMENLSQEKLSSNYYNVHQLYRTIHYRCAKANNWDAALHYLYQGALYLFDVNEINSGNDLLKLYFEIVQRHKIVRTDHLRAIVNCLGNANSKRSDHLRKILSLVDGDLGESKTFNEMIGRKYWSEGRFGDARNYLIRCENGYLLGVFLIDCHLAAGYSNEVDLFIAQAVLHCLALRKNEMANATYHAYTRRHPYFGKLPETASSKDSDATSGARPTRDFGPPFMHYPLLNFLWFLLIAVDRQATLAVFHILCEKYASCLSRDACYAIYLERISFLYFGVTPMNTTNSTRPNMLVNILDFLMGNDENGANTGSSSMTSAPDFEPLQLLKDEMD